MWQPLPYYPSIMRHINVFHSHSCPTPRRAHYDPCHVFAGMYIVLDVLCRVCAADVNEDAVGSKRTALLVAGSTMTPPPVTVISCFLHSANLRTHNERIIQVFRPSNVYSRLESSAMGEKAVSRTRLVTSNVIFVYENPVSSPRKNRG